MATLLIDLSPHDMADRLGEALRVYVTAMGYPPGTENQRAAMWLDHTRRRGWQGVAALNGEDGGSSAELLGIAYGYCGAPDQWWQQQVVLGLQRRGLPRHAISRLMTSYFELTELHVMPHSQGSGLGEALARRLLARRAEANVLLSTPEISGEGNRAWRLYRRLGFTDVIRGHHFAGDPRPFAILGRPLPLEQSSAQHPAGLAR
ncbi:MULTISPECIES: GNAT family N-acetyltransferase [Mycolicibacter]|uniref:Acetyltransferase n=2 Tax=Mycolicibacter TaxID=1073531 RepID=A0A1A2Y4Q4_MYCSD|nr:MULTISPECIES: GNAT family N-acetyltransferase [Mycolicibacter]OBH15041.1 acetyltransferase [Mycolicibacter sinensis]OBI32277.1 acetyltransferase [Mycolicibacter sinensis]